MWALIAAVIAVAASAGVYYQQRKMEAQAKKQAQEAKAVQISGHDSNRGLYTVYGKALIGSTTVWKKVSDKQTRMTQTGFTTFSRGTGDLINGTRDLKSNRFLYRAVSLCAGPIQSVENILIDDEGYQSSRFGQGDDRHFAASVSLGPTAGQNFSAMRTSFSSDFGAWGSTFTGKGVAYAIERLYLDNDKPAYQGEPSTKYLVKGRKLYDPRKDSTSSVYDATLGTSSHRFDTPSTWEWSDNPVLALLDYMTNSEYGRGLALSVIDLPSIADSADKCDVLVDIPGRLTNDTGSSYQFYDAESGEVITVQVDDDLPNHRREQGSTAQQKRFRLNIAIDPSKELLDNIQEILNVFRGNLSYANGKYRVHMADVASPVLTIGDDDIITGLKISNGDRAQRMNRATIKFINANKQHKTDQVSWPSLDSNEDDGLYDTYLTEDQGEKLHKTFTIKGCTDYYQAQDTAEFLVRDSRSNLTVAGTFGSRCFGLVPGDVVSLTYDSAGYSGKYFRVMQVAIDLNSMNVNLQLKEYDSSVYTWNDARGTEPEGLSWQEEVVNAAPITPVIGTLSSTTRTRADGSTALTLTVPFSNIPEQAQYVDVEWGINGTDQYNSQVVFDTENINQVEVPIERDNVTYAVRVRYFITDSAGTLMSSNFATDTITVGTLTGTKLGGIEEGATANNIYQQADEPTGGTYNDGDIWIDTDDGYRMYLRSGGAWVDRADTRIATAITDAAGAQATADGKVVTFFQDAEPADASSSTGDLWIDTNDSNKLYRYNGTDWESVRDAGIASAISSAATAQSTADGKIVTFYQDDEPADASSSTGDLWFDTNDNNKLYRYNGTDWVSARDAGIATALSNAATAQSTADGKIVTFYQDGEPAAASSSEGDLWIDTNDSNKLYRFNGTDWVAARDSGIASAISDAATAQATADGKVTTFYAASSATPTPEGTGDLWYQTDTQLFFRYNGSAWQEVASYNTGALADLDTVDTPQIEDNAVDIAKIADTLQSTNYSAGSAGWKLTTDGTFEAGDGTFRGDVTAKSFTIEAGATVSGLEAQAVAGLPQASFTSIGASTYSPAVNGSRVTWTENATTEAWDTKLVSDQSFSGGAFVTFVVNTDNASNSRYMVGLANVATGNSFSVIDYAIFVRGTSSDLVAYESGVSPGALKSGISAGDVCTVLYDGNKVQYIINGAVEREVDLTSPLTGQIYAHIAIDDGSTQDVEHRIDGLQFGPVTSVVENLNDGVSLTSGGLTLSSGGAIKGGQTAYDNGTGFFLGYENSAYKLSIGNSAGDKLTFDGADLTVTGDITATSLTLSGTSIAEGQLAQGVQDSLGLADSALQNGDDITDGTVGGVTITSTKLYQGTGTFNNSNTGFYLDNTAQFSLKDKLSFDGTDLTVSGDVTAANFTLSSGATLDDTDGQIANVAININFPIEGLTYYWPCNSIANDELVDVVGGKTGTHDGVTPTLSTDSPSGNSIVNALGSGWTLLNDTDADNLEGANGFAWSIWFRSETTAGDSEARIIGRDASDGWALIIDQAGTSQGLVLYGEPGTESMGTIAANQWHHFVLSEDGNGTISGYLDGELIGTEAYSPVNSSRPVVIGCNTESSINTSASRFVGKLTEVRAYNRALTALEVRALYKVPAGGLPQKLDGDMIVTGSITASQLAADAVTAGKINVSSLADINADAGTITGGSVGGTTITATKLYQGTGTHNNTNTGFYLDSSGNFSLKDKLSFDGTTLSVDGNVTVDEFVKAGSGSTAAVMSGRAADNFAFWAGADFDANGGASGANAPFRVTRAGKVIMTNFALYSTTGQKLFDSTDGLLGLPSTQVAASTGSLVSSVSDELTGATDYATIQLSSTQTITVDFDYPLNYLFASGSSEANAYGQVATSITVTIQKSTDASTWSTFGSVTFNKTDSSSASTSQYYVQKQTVYLGSEFGGGTLYFASLQPGGAVDDGNVLNGNVSASLATGTHYLRMQVSYGGSGLAASGIPSTTEARSINLTTSGAGFTVDSNGNVSDGVSTSATTGWVLSNFVEKTESDNVTINGTLTLGGDLVVNGTTTTINSTTLSVDDKNIVLADGAANAAAADGAGITIDGASASFTYNSTADSFRTNKRLEPSTFRINDSSDMGFGITKAGSTVGHTASVDEGIFWHTTNDYGIYRTAGAWTNPDYPYLKVAFGTGIKLDGGTAGQYTHTGVDIVGGSDLQMAGNTVIDASRNITAGTISSGAITSSGLITTGAVTGDGLLLPKTGTATSGTQTYNSPDIRLEASGWDTNNSFARTVSWVIRNEPTASVYPDFDLNFIQRADGSDATTFTLHGRGTSGHVDPKAGTFFGNLHVEAGSGTGAGAGDLTVAGAISSSGGDSSQWNTAYGWGDHASEGYLTSLSFDNLTGKTSGTGDYSTTGDLVAGRNSGSIALTINDGKGNSNIAFNHQNGVPDQNGNAARIEVNTDSSTGAAMYFELKSGVTDGVSVDLTNIFHIDENGLDMDSGMGIKINGTEVISSSRDLTPANITATGSISGGGKIKTQHDRSDSYSDTPSWTEQDWDTLVLYNGNSTTSADQMSSIFMRADGGGSASSRIVLRNDNSGNGRLYFMMRSGAHTDVQQPKMLITDDGYVTISDNATTYNERLFVDGTLRAEDGIKIGATQIIDSNRDFTNVNSLRVTGANGLAIGKAPTSFGSGVSTLTLAGTSSTNGRAGAIWFKEYDGTDTGAIYSTDGADGYGTVMVAYQGDLKLATGTLSGYALIAKANKDVNIVSGGLQMGGTEVISSGRAVTATGATIGGNQTGTILTIEASDTAGAPATTTQIQMIGYEGRGIGTFYEDVSYSGKEWFSGMQYGGNFSAFVIGYSASGGQAEYSSNAIARFTSDGDFQIGTTTVIDSSRNLTPAGITTTESVQIPQGYNVQWGGPYSSGNPSMSAGSNFIAFYPTGNVDGEVIRFDADGIDLNGHNLTEVNSFTLNGAGSTIQLSGDRTGLIEITDSGQSYTGIQISQTEGDHWSVMGNTDVFGLYDDENADWILLYSQGGGTLIYHNGNAKLETTASGVSITGAIQGSSDVEAHSGYMNLSTYTSGTVPITVGMVDIRSAGKTGWAPGDELGKVRWYANDTSGNWPGEVASIRAVCQDGNGSTTTVGSAALEFYTTPYNSITQAMALRLNTDQSATFPGAISSGVITAEGASGGKKLTYASNFAAASASIQLTLERTTDSVGWGAIGADSTYCFSAWTDTPARRFSVTHGGVANATAGYQVNGTDVINSARTLTVNGGNHNISGGTTTFNVGRGDVYFEDNSNSNASGAGITLRTGNNPSGDGSIFDVRSSGQAIRFYVGQDLTSSGYNPFYVGCGTTTGQGTASNYVIELATNGNIIAEGNVTAYGSASDIRLKENIEPITDALGKVKRLDGVTFNYKKDGSRSTGVIAQQVQEVLPEVIYESAEVGKSEDGEKFLAVRYGQMMGLAIEAIKELSAEVDSLKAKLKELEDGNH